MIPLTRLSVGEAEAAAAADAVRSGWLSTGKRVQEFEAMVAEYVGARHAIAVSSCTAALHLSLIAAGVKPGDEVICPSFSFIATANAIRCAGASPVFVDIDPRTYNIDPKRIEAAITLKTAAIMPVSQIGLAADIPAIRSIARMHGLKLVEDAAASLGARIGRNRIGTLSDFTCFSFASRNILTTGEGGVITTDDKEAAARLVTLRAHATLLPTLDRHTTADVALESYPEMGYNYKMTDIQAAIGIVQTSRIEDIIDERRRLGNRYNTMLQDDNRIELPFEPLGFLHVYQSYCIRLLKKPQLDVMKSLAGQDIASRRILAIHLEPVYREQVRNYPLTESEKASRETILLPMFVGLTDSEQDEVIRALNIALE